MKPSRLDRVEMWWISSRSFIWATFILHAFFGLILWPLFVLFDLFVLTASIAFDRYLVYRMPKKEEPTGFVIRARGIDYRPEFVYKGLVVVNGHLRVHHWEALPIRVPKDVTWDELKFVRGNAGERSLITWQVYRDLVTQAKEPA